MINIIKIEKNPINNSGIILGGSGFIKNDWPVNPKGEKLTCLLTIDCDRLNKKIPFLNLPTGKIISVFSTYSPNRYFLDDIIYSGDNTELNDIKKGFTKVVIADSTDKKISGNLLPTQYTKLIEKSISETDFPTISFFSEDIPNGMKGYSKIKEEYRFVCQIYSSDLPTPDGGALGLSDANGYLFLKRIITNENDAGLFFVQSA